MLENSLGYHLPANSYSKCSFVPVAAFDDGHFAAEEGTWAIEDFMAVAMFCCADAVVVGVIMDCAVSVDMRHND